MKKLYKLLTAAMLGIALLPQSAAAYDFMADGIAYNINNDGTTVTVTASVNLYDEGDLVPPEGNYDGLTEANIPSSVTHNGQNYTVTK